MLEKLQQKIPNLNASGQVCALCLCDLILQIQAVISTKQNFVDSEAEYFSFFFVLKKHVYIEKNLQCNSLLVATSKPARLIKKDSSSVGCLFLPRRSKKCNLTTKNAKNLPHKIPSYLGHAKLMR